MTLHPQAVAALREWSAGPQVTDPGFGAADIDAKRQDARADAAREAREPVERVEDVDADGVPCRLYVPTATRDTTGPARTQVTGPVISPVISPGVLVFLHGGGFVFGDLDTHDAQSRRLANRTGLAVLTVDYRRPPEHRFPAAPDDVDTALAWLAREGDDHGLDTSRVAAIGDSAGGNLALVATLRRPGRFVATVLVYPFLDPATDQPSYDSPDGGLTRGEAQWYWQHYAGSPTDLDHQDLAPLLSPPARFARVQEPVLVQAAEHDVLVDEDLLLARRLSDAGVDVRLTTYAGMIHGFWRHPEAFDAAEESLAEAAAFLREHV
jgi:acetyl esterase